MSLQKISVHLGRIKCRIPLLEVQQVSVVFLRSVSQKRQPSLSPDRGRLVSRWSLFYFSIGKFEAETEK